MPCVVFGLNPQQFEDRLPRRDEIVANKCRSAAFQSRDLTASDWYRRLRFRHSRDETRDDSRHQQIEPSPVRG